MGAILGLRGTGDYAADQRPTSYREGILTEQPLGDVPLTAFTSRMRQRPATDPKFQWWDIKYQPRILTAVGPDLAASTAGAQQTIAVTGLANFCPAGTNLFVANTGEVMRVLSDPTSDTSLFVQRGWGLDYGTICLASVGGQLTHIGSANAEGSGAPKAVSRNPNRYFNWTQIFKTSVNFTNTARATELRTGNDEEWQRADRLKDHMRDMERAFMFGVKSENIDPVDGTPIRTTDGMYSVLNQMAPSNIVDLAGHSNLAALDAFLQVIFAKGSAQRVCMGGNAFISGFNRLIQNNINYMKDPSTYSEGQGKGKDGEAFVYNFKRIESPYGDIMMLRHPMLTLDPAFNNSGWFLDFEDLAYVPLTGRDTHLRENVQAPDADAKKDQILTECGLEFHFPEHHGILRNL
jgi:hypothetical protein